MTFFDILWMTKPKIILLAVFLALLFPSYYNISCISTTCLAGAGPCPCGFSPIDFFTCFVWAYVTACLIIEVIKIFRRKKPVA